MTKTINYFSLIFALYIVMIGSECCAQDLLPKIDQNPHLVEVHHFAVSPNMKFVVMADVSGVISFRHLETGKLMRRFPIGIEIIDLAFAGDNNIIYALFQEENLNANGKTFSLKIAKIDLLTEERDDDWKIEKKAIRNEETIVVQNINDSLDSQGFKFKAGIDVSPDNQNIIIKINSFDTNLFSNFISNYYIVPLNNWNNIEKIHSIEGVSYGSFIDKTTYEVMAGVDLTESYTYDITKGIIDSIENKALKGSKLIYDQNNTILRQSGDNLFFENKIENFVYSIAKDGFLLKDSSNDYSQTSNLNNFSFSDSGKYLSALGNYQSLLSKQESADEVYLHFYDSEADSLIYNFRTKDIDSKLKILGVKWIEEKVFIVVDELGQIYFYNTYQDHVFRKIELVRDDVVSIDVSSNLNHVLYSKQNDLTGLLVCDQSTPFEIFSSEFSSKCAVSDEGTFAFNQGIYKAGINRYSNPLRKADHLDVLISNDGSKVIYNTGYRYSDIPIHDTTLIVDAFLKNVNSDIIGYKSNGRSYYKWSNESLPEVSELKINAEQDNCIYVFDFDVSSIPFVIWPGDHINVELSNNGRYLVIETINEGIHVFDLIKKDWKNIQYKGKSKEISNMVLDPYSNIACVFFDKNLLGKRRYVLWDAKDDRVISECQIRLNSDFENVIINNHTEELIFFDEDHAQIVDYVSREKNKIFENRKINKHEFSPDGQYLYVQIQRVYKSQTYFTHEVLHYPSLKSIYTKNIEKAELKLLDDLDFKAIFFHSTKPLFFINNGAGTLDLVDLSNDKEATSILKLKLLSDGEWIAYTSKGYFDASKRGREGLYYLYNDNVILYEQIKDEYWIPGLLGRLIDDPEFTSSKINRSLELYPMVNLEFNDILKGVDVELESRIGGIGRYSVFINNKEVFDDKNTLGNSKFHINLVYSDHYSSYLKEGEINKISVVSYNKSGWLRSRPYDIFVKKELKSEGSNTIDHFFVVNKEALIKTQSMPTSDTILNNRPGLFGLFVGSSEYYNNKLNLAYADKDAKKLKQAISLISDKMYDQERISLKVLVSDSIGDGLAVKNNIIRELEYIADNALANDIIILFFSGHGVAIDEEFYLLTTEANINWNDNKTKRKEVTLSTTELNKILKEVKSSKQLLVLDACYSGKITDIIKGNGKSGLSSSQEKALEFLNDKTGVYILSSSESEQKSYESSDLQQGLLTYSLILSMTKGVNQDDIINILELLNNTTLNTERLSKKLLDNVQRPIMDVVRGANSFPIGTTNDSLNIPIPKGKILFNRPQFGFKDLYVDTEEFELIAHEILKLNGTSLKNGQYIYTPGNRNAYTIAGSYDVEDETMTVIWRIYLGKELIAGPTPISKPLSKKYKIADKIIRDARDYLLNKKQNQ